MKDLAATTVLFAIASAVFVQFAAGQGFAPIGTQWYYGEAFAFAPGQSYLSYEVVDDTLINGKSCSVIQGHGLACYYNIKIVYYEDSVAYFYVPAIDEFQVLYDLRAEAGDAWKVVFGYDFTGTYLDSTLVEVDSVGSVDINGHQLKKMYVRYRMLPEDMSWSYTSEIVERIGDMEGLCNLYPGSTDFICEDEYPIGLRCFEDPVLGYYETGIANSCTASWVGVGGASPPPDAFEVFPNPTGGHFQLKAKGIADELGFELYGIGGKTALSGKFRSQADLDISGLPPGLYFLAVKYNGNLLGLGKVLKN